MVPGFGGTLNIMHRPPERPRTTGQANNEARQLDFTAAMNDFKHMFPNVDREVIEAILRANNGLVDATIDQLLSMGLDMEGCNTSSTQSDLPPLPSYNDVDRSEPPPAYTPRDVEISPSSGRLTRPLPARPYSAWNPPLLGKLPDDFLRLGPSSTSSPGVFGDSMGDQELERFLEDEKLAMVLQNEEFMRELRHNKDFMLSLEKDRQRNTVPSRNKKDPENNLNLMTPVEAPSRDVPVATGGSNSSRHAPQPLTPTSVPSVSPETSGAVGGHPAPAAGSASSHDDAVLREKLKHMGKSTRKKFDKLARMFHRKNVNRANLIATGTAASTANLLEGYNEDDDDEMLNAMGSARLEIMDERDEDKEREKSPQRSASQQKLREAEQRKATGSVEPIVFFSDDNEFQFKQEN